jgi:hypothetical protein
MKKIFNENNQLEESLPNIERNYEEKKSNFSSSYLDEEEKYRLKKEISRYSIDLILLEKELLILKGKIKMIAFKYKLLIFITVVILIILISQTCLKSYSNGLFQKIKHFFKMGE